MGVLNVTDDSFSDGGRYLDADAAVAHGLTMAAEGAEIVDVGGESTRPGAIRIDPQVETHRVIPVIKALAAQGITVSIDTMHADVARAALQNGAQIVNDVSGGRADPAMAPLLASAASSSDGRSSSVALSTSGVRNVMYRDIVDWATPKMSAHTSSMMFCRRYPQVTTSASRRVSSRGRPSPLSHGSWSSPATRYSSSSSCSASSPDIRSNRNGFSDVKGLV